MPESPPTSLRAYAKRRGVSAEAVSKAISAGRLHQSVAIIGGQPKIADVDAADREWEANTRPRIDHPQQPRASRPLDPSGGASDVPDYNVSRAMREAAEARRSAAEADIAEIKAAEKKGELISVDEARGEVQAKFAIIRTRILGVPTRVAQRLPSLASEVVPVLDDLLREALEELADGDELAG